MRAFHPFLAAAALALSASPALAQDAPLPPLPVGAAQSAPRLAYSQDERDGWLSECHHRLSDNGVGGAVIDRRQAPDRVREECENYLDRYEAGNGGGSYGQARYAYNGAGYAYTAAQGCTSGCGTYPAAPAGMMWVPVVMSGQGCCCQSKPKVRTIVTEEEVPETIEQAPPPAIRTKYTKTKYTKTQAVPAKPRPIKSIK